MYSRRYSRQGHGAPYPADCTDLWGTAVRVHAIHLPNLLFFSDLSQYKKIARKIMHSPGYGYSSIMEGYKHIFNEVLSKEMAPKAYEIFAKNIG